MLFGLKKRQIPTRLLEYLLPYYEAEQPSPSLQPSTLTSTVISVIFATAANHPVPSFSAACALGNPRTIEDEAYFLRRVEGVC